MAPLPHPGAPLMKTCARERCPPTAVLKAMLAKGSVKFGLGMKLGRMEGAKEARASPRSKFRQDSAPKTNPARTHTTPPDKHGRAHTRIKTVVRRDLADSSRFGRPGEGGQSEEGLEHREIEYQPRDPQCAVPGTWT